MTISTVSFGYRGMVNLGDCLKLLDEAEERLEELEAETGKNVAIAFEPEPDTVWGGGVSEMLELLAPGKHRTVLLDACHAAVMNEQPHECLARIVRAGFPLCRVQISAAIIADSSQTEALARFSKCFSGCISGYRQAQEG